MDGLLAKEDQQLPFAGHVVPVFDDLVFDWRPEMVQFMGTEKVVVSDPESKLVVGTVIVIKPIRGAVGCLVSAVELEPTDSRGGKFRPCRKTREPRTKDHQDLT